MNDSKINEVYQYITEMHNKYLKKYGVVLPNLKKKGKYTKDALTLVYLAQGYPDTKVISKKELTEEEKFKILRSKRIDTKVVEYLMNKLNNK